jgi:hypothetical protein
VYFWWLCLLPEMRGNVMIEALDFFTFFLFKRVLWRNLCRHELFVDPLVVNILHVVQHYLLPFFVINLL